MESIIGLYKTECTRREGPWRGVDDVELATLGWVHWFNNERLHGALGYLTPLEFEADHYRHNQPRQQPLSGQTRPPLNPGRFTSATITSSFAASAASLAGSAVSLACSAATSSERLRSSDGGTPHRHRNHCKQADLTRKSDHNLNPTANPRPSATPDHLTAYLTGVRRNASIDSNLCAALTFDNACTGSDSGGRRSA
jgi:hypothetical protein